MALPIHCYNPPTDAELGCDREDEGDDLDAPALPLDPGAVDHDASTVPQPETPTPTRLDVAA